MSLLLPRILIRAISFSILLSIIGRLLREEAKVITRG